MPQSLPIPIEDTAEATSERVQVVSSLASLSLPLMWSLRQRAMQVYEPFSVRPTRVLMMEMVDRGVTSPKTLAELLEAVPPAVTAMANELIDKGWLLRETDPEDGRRVRLRLTPSGQEALRSLRRAWLDASREELERFDLSELRTVLSVFNRLLGNTT